MQIRKTIAKIVKHNWKAKLVCLGIAVLVWGAVYKLVKSDDTPVWEVNEVLTTQPE